MMSILYGQKAEDTKHKVFISYHHLNDQEYKEKLLKINDIHKIFLDVSVDTHEIDDSLPDESIREIIRDEYLKNSTVTILFVGVETKKRKHVDWELYSSMFDGKRNKRSGVFVINLPSINCSHCSVSHEGEKTKVHSDITNWVTVTERSEYERRYPYMPARIIDNLLAKDAKISVVDWDKIANDPSKLSFLIETVHSDREANMYDLSRPMKRANS
jgi:hypothetical protein